MGKLLDQLNIKAQEKLNNLNVPVSLWGNGVVDSISHHHEFDLFQRSFEDLRVSENQPPEVFLVIGPINQTQLKNLKENYEHHKDRKPFVVYAEGLLSKKILKFAPDIVKDIRNHIPIDLEYQKHPLQLDELVSEIISLIKGQDE